MSLRGQAALASGNGLPEIVASSFGEWTETRGAIAAALDAVAFDHVAVDSGVDRATA